MTQGVQDEAARREWLEQRRTGVGGSDVGPIMGFPMFGRTAVTVWEEKTGKRPLDTRITPPIKRGRLLEPILKLLYKEETGRDVMEVPPSMVRNAKAGHLFANVDTVAIESPEVMRVVELKAPGLQNHRKWKLEGLPFGYLLQLTSYMDTVAIPIGAFGFGNMELMDMVCADFELDEDLAEQIRNQTGEFWEKYVKTDTMPPLPLPPEGLPETVRGEIVAAVDGYDEAALAYAEASALVKEAEAIKEAAKAALGTLLLDHQADVMQSSLFRTYYREQEGRVTFDKAALAKVQPVDAGKLALALLEYGLTPTGVQTLLAETRLDLDPFHKRGKPFRSIANYPITKGATYE